MKVDPRFKDTEYVVEADSYAMQSLWERWSTEALHKHKDFNFINWRQDSMGSCVHIGDLDKRPVVVTFFWAKLNGHLVVFWEATSEVVDYKMVEEWLGKYCNPQHNDRRSRCDANNFHHVIEYINDCHAEELLDLADAHAEEGNPDDCAKYLSILKRTYPYKFEKEIKALEKEIKGMKC